jgi:hypothetical protein
VVFNFFSGSPFLQEFRGAYSNCQYRVVQSNAGNISAKWVTNLSRRFGIFPTGWSNCSHGNGATAHMAQMQCEFSVHFQADSYLVLGDITWLTRSPDHAVLDYFLSVYDQSKV